MITNDTLIEIVDSSDEPLTFGEFCELNDFKADADYTVWMIRNLNRDGQHSGGGGAASEWTIRLAYTQF